MSSVLCDRRLRYATRQGCCSAPRCVWLHVAINLDLLSCQLISVPSWFSLLRALTLRLRHMTICWYTTEDPVGVCHADYVRWTNVHGMHHILRWLAWARRKGCLFLVAMACEGVTRSGTGARVRGWMTDIDHREHVKRTWSCTYGAWRLWF